MPTQALQQDIILLQKIQDEALKTKAVLEQQQAALNSLGSGTQSNLVIDMMTQLKFKIEETTGAYKTLVAAQQQVIANAKLMQSTSSGTGGVNVVPEGASSQDIILLQKIQNEALKTKAVLEKQQAALNSLGSGTQNNLVIDMMTQLKFKIEETTGAYETLVAAQQQVIANAKLMQSTSSGTGGVNVVPGGASSSEAADAKEATMWQEKFTAEAEKGSKHILTASQQRKIDTQAALAAEEKRLDLIREQVRTSDRYSKANQLAQNAGMQAGNLTSIKEIGTSGVQKLTYASQDELTGINHQLDLFVTKSGDAIPAINRQFQTMGTAIARDTVELLKWTIAIGIIYGPLRELQTLSQEMIANQAALATSMIALVGQSTSVAQVFGIIKDAANAMGEDVGKSIDIFTQAYRATGGLGSQYERIQTATKLMADAMTLSKLSGMDYNTAIDTLTSSLRQVGLGLEDGTTLLDEWVTVSKVANVDLQTLSTGFSILGESASEAGLSTKELNALLATISETLSLTDRTAGNAAKAFISGFGTSKAQKALQDIGVAATDLNGQLRPIVDIMKDVTSLYNAGVLSGAQFTQVTAAVGGGTRNQAKVAAVFNSMGRYNDIVTAQDNTQGAAAGALATKLDTVQTALTRLGNALQSVAQTMGDKGGLLDDFTILLNLVTGLVQGIDSLASAAGKAAPVLATILLGSALVGFRPDIGTSLKNGLISVLSPGMGGTTGRGGGAINPGVETAPGVSRAATSTGGGPSAAAMFMTGGTNLSGAALGGLVGILPAIQNLSQGNPGAAGGNLLGGITGGAIGMSLGGPTGAMIGASIGSAIAEAFVKNVLEYKGEIGGAFAQAEKNSTAQAAMDAARLGKTVPGNTAEENFMAVQEKVLDNGPVGKIGNQFMSGMMNFILGGSKLLGQNTPSGSMNPEMAGYYQASPELKKQYDDAYKALLISQGSGTSPIGASALAQAQIQNDPKIKQMAIDMQKAMQDQLLAQLTGRNLGGSKPTQSITSAQYTAGMQNIGGFGEVAARFQTTFGTEFQQQATGIKDMKDAYSAFINLLVYGGDTETKTLTELASQIANVTDHLAENNLTININGDEITKTKQEWEDYLDTLRKTAGASAAAITNQITMSQLKAPNVVGGNTPLQNVGQFNAIYSYAQTLDTQRVKAMNPLMTDSQLAQYRKGLDSFITLVVDAGKEVYKKVEGVSPQSFQESEAWLKQQGQASRTQPPGNAQFQEINLPSSMLGTINDATKVMEYRLQQSGMPINEQDMVAYFNDDQFKSLHLDSVALRLVLEQILGVQQKQLDQGMWNVPGNATIMVPINSLWNATHNGAQGGGGGSPVTTGPKYTEPNTGPVTTAPSLDNQDWIDYLKNNPPPIQGNKIVKGVVNKPGIDSMTGLPYQGSIYQGHGISGIGVAGEKSGATSGGNWINEPSTGGGNWLQNIFQNLFKTMPSVSSPGWSRIGENVNGALTKFSLNLTSHTTLTVDGRTLATIIKPYLLDDLMNISKAYGTTSKNYVI